jgi:hypothetical protein
MPAQATTR